MAAKTRDELVTEYVQYSPTGLGTLEKILLSEIKSCNEGINDPDNTPEYKAYWQKAKQDAQLELSVCLERLA